MKNVIKIGLLLLGTLLAGCTKTTDKAIPKNMSCNIGDKTFTAATVNATLIAGVLLVAGSSGSDPDQQALAFTIKGYNAKTGSFDIDNANIMLGYSIGNSQYHAVSGSLVIIAAESNSMKANFDCMMSDGTHISNGVFEVGW